MSLFVTVNNEMDRTVKIFDEFYATDLVIPANAYSLVLSYFKEQCDTVSIAENFTAVFFRIAQEAGIEPVELLELLQQNTNNKISLNKVFCYYLNTFKSKSSLYGVAVVPKPLEPVARNVVL
jgi:hypothetical protein